MREIERWDHHHVAAARVARPGAVLGAFAGRGFGVTRALPEDGDEVGVLESERHLAVGAGALLDKLLRQPLELRRLDKQRRLVGAEVGAVGRARGRVGVEEPLQLGAPLDGEGESATLEVGEQRLDKVRLIRAEGLGLGRGGKGLDLVEDVEARARRRLEGRKLLAGLLRRLAQRGVRRPVLQKLGLADERVGLEIGLKHERLDDRGECRRVGRRDRLQVGLGIGQHARRAILNLCHRYWPLEGRQLTVKLIDLNAHGAEIDAGGIRISRLVAIGRS